MDLATALLTLAQIALGLAGFSSVLVALSGKPEGWLPIDSFRIVAMLWTSFFALFLSLAPFVLNFLGVGAALTWRLCAGLIGVLTLLAVAGTTRRILRLPRPDRRVLGRSVVFAVQSLVLLAGLCELAAAFGWLGPPDGIYFAGIVAYMCLAAFLIVRFLFARPPAT
jgi:hypothetical protein